MNELENILLIIPSLDPDEHLITTVEGMLKVGFSKILLVNDGSKKENLAVFNRLKDKYPKEITLIGYEINRGKGHALKTAFSYAMKNEPDLIGVVTADGDGQHSAKDAARLAKALRQNPKKVIFGCRNFKKPRIPFRNKLGNLITREVFHLLYGLKIDDAQTGLRAFPMDSLPKLISVEGERFEYESNMLMKLREFKLDFLNVEIETIYIDDGKASHFRPLKDSFRIYKPIFLYILSGSLCSLIDLGSFTLILYLLGSLATAKNLFISTLFARVISSLCNFFINKKTVFKSKISAKKSLWRYYSLALVQLFLSYGGVKILTSLLGITGLFASFIKALVDILLSIFSFRVQKLWVFLE